ncbi:MAG: hypothetical protein KAR42_11080 [candidate division Zixibacteria bacterium]|nr:hypothetical protein [candidate division Zixibacteria bacterium]
MNQIIPLVGGAVNAHQKFEVQLGKTFAQFEIDYRTLTEQWSASITVEGVELVSGASLQPNVDIIQHWQLGGTLGQLVFVGDDPTLDNLGASNSLVWVPNS